MADEPKIAADRADAPRRGHEPRDDDADGVSAPRPRLGRELRFFLLLGGAGIVLLPFLVYFVGTLTLGPYEGGLGSFLAKLYGDFVRLVPSAWALLLGPYVLFWAVRLLTRPLRRRTATAP